MVLIEHDLFRGYSVGSLAPLGKVLVRINEDQIYIFTTIEILYIFVNRTSFNFSSANRRLC